MYIFAGRFKGRRLFFPPMPVIAGKIRRKSSEKLRPTTGLVRRALFDILAPIISDSSFLDLYAGTGAVGLEAVSRGAGKVLLVESNPKTALYLKQNLELIKAAAKKEGNEIAEENLMFYPYLTEKAISILAGKKEGFDIIFADPPYDFSAQKIAELIAQISEGGILRPGGKIILQHISGLEKNLLFQESVSALTLAVETRRYGYTSLSLFFPPSAPAE
ncbi:MAG: 16S rRNA (guanine(966)-N(2))-methyltransferase RsmD [Candidatus Omnitrophica bacterium]|nr:16S rRNA (guanine(966)-N(2))-methyltransferase RsmD [Candidatus Omnitrophota bacterium]